MIRNYIFRFYAAFLGCCILCPKLQGVLFFTSREVGITWCATQFTPEQTCNCVPPQPEYSGYLSLRVVHCYLSPVLSRV